MTLIDYTNEKIRHLADLAWRIADSQIEVPEPHIVRFQFEFARLIALDAAAAADMAQEARCPYIGDYVVEQLGFTVGDRKMELK